MRVRAKAASKRSSGMRIIVIFGICGCGPKVATLRVGRVWKGEATELVALAEKRGVIDALNALAAR